MDAIANMAALVILAYMLMALGDVLTEKPIYRLSTAQTLGGIGAYVGMIAALAAAVVRGLLA